MHVGFSLWSLFDFFDWLGCKVMFFVFSLFFFGFNALYALCILSSILLLALLIQLLLLIKEKKKIIQR